MPTIAEDSTPQQVFDYVVNHLRTQGEAAFHPSNGCRYRTERGMKCAAGCLISDAEYDPDMEGLLVRNISESPKYKLSDFFTRNLKLLQGLQCAHDIFLHRDGLAAMERKLQNIADSHNLVYTKP